MAMSNGRSTSNGSASGTNAERIRTLRQASPEGASTTTTATTMTTTTTTTTATAKSKTTTEVLSAQQLQLQPTLFLGEVSPPTAATSLALTSVATTNTPAASSASVTHVSQKTVEALGDWLLESASVQSSSLSVQEQRRRQGYKSSALVNKTMKQSQEERRRIALSEQAKKRYQFTNHARKLALFASGQPSEDTSDSDADDSQHEDEDEDDVDEEEEDEDVNNDNIQDNNNGAIGCRKKKKKRSSKQFSADSGKDSSEGRSTMEMKVTAAHKRRLSSGSESDSAGGRKADKTKDVLSPKKPRLQNTSPKVPRKKRKDRNPFRDQLMIPEAMTDIPADLDTNYYLVPLPTGHRCFVISADGKTTARLPSGQLLVSAFESCLPAGSPQYRGNRRTDYCILDCVYSSVTRTFWTLDIMCWRGHPVYECETEFRFWWLRGKLAEIESLQSKWIANQTREWEQEAAKRKQKKARQLKRRQERAAAAAAAASMDVVPPEVLDPHGDGDDGDDEAGPEVMDVEDHTRADDGNTGTASSARKFWPIVFTPLPYFNASINLIRLLAESMYQPTPSPSLTASLLTGPSSMIKDTTNGAPAPLKASSTSKAAAIVVPPAPLSTIPAAPSSSMLLSASKWAPATTFSSKPSSSGLMNKSDSMNGSKDHCHSNGIKSNPVSISLSTLGTMALSGEIATAASLFPAHDNAQKLRQEQALVHERAAGLVFFNKKTMYVLGMTPLCGWVTMEQIGDVFFGEEGGIGPVPGTSAVEGREVEMEDALERIRI
ncbi:hypothetical protein BGX34_006081 [Mortierella sp. NVP85]|nr:hypothetical protein BGX34_006081 [Mortierella sp. NVP85]